MGVFAQFVLGISAAAIFIGALFMILPGGAMQKSVRYVCSLVFICVCVTAFLKLGRVEFKVNSEKYEVDMSRAISLTNTQAQYICAAVLESADIKYEKISVNTDKDEQNSIFINSITVYSSADAKLIERTIRQSMEVKTVKVKK